MSQLFLLQAMDFAARKHRDQRRKDENASPYINHPIAVALVLAEVGGVNDPEVLAAAILHDTIEDTGTTPEELEKIFGARVRSLVEEVTDDKQLPKLERKQRQIEHARELSPGATMIKLGDKINNVRDITHSPPVDWSLERRQEYLNWAEAVINNCPSVNADLRACFFRILAQGRQRLTHPD
ncbi:phosphohydrolase [Leptolyngbya sp. 'hensonii']|uniref:HD domain-containing protein n=1 Tax=Leptolyngbya sp. 'hensonii' TaxID=1922337 RepID=UPI0009502B03|nr:HD domain-containing protein [Leptolyngbya sp. 'hensonii']OLP17373.1 phosphohydrolase [Leptolyngbya sp. 'hensonii']